MSTEVEAELKVIDPRVAYQHMVKTFNMSIGAKPDWALRANLIKEEAQEFIEAVAAKDVVALIDAICDLLYVIYGAADVFKVWLDTQEAEKTPIAHRHAPDWRDLDNEIDDFNLSATETIQSIKDLKKIPTHLTVVQRTLEEFAQGLWACGAEGLGVDIAPFFREVHRTNMHKLTGPIREDGKQLKPPGWKPPRIKALYERAMKHQTLECNRVDCLRGLTHKFDIAEVIEHPDGGHHCSRCGGLFTEVELDVGMQMRKEGKIR